MIRKNKSCRQDISHTGSAAPANNRRLWRIRGWETPWGVCTVEWWNQMGMWCDTSATCGMLERNKFVPHRCAQVRLFSQPWRPWHSRCRAELLNSMWMTLNHTWCTQQQNIFMCHVDCNLKLTTWTHLAGFRSKFYRHLLQIAATGQANNAQVFYVRACVKVCGCVDVSIMRAMDSKSLIMYMFPMSVPWNSSRHVILCLCTCIPMHVYCNSHRIIHYDFPIEHDQMSIICLRAFYAERPCALIQTHTSRAQWHACTFKKNLDLDTCRYTRVSGCMHMCECTRPYIDVHNIHMHKFQSKNEDMNTHWQFPYTHSAVACILSNINTYIHRGFVRLPQIHSHIKTFIHTLMPRSSGYRHRQTQPNHLFTWRHIKTW